MHMCLRNKVIIYHERAFGKEKFNDIILDDGKYQKFVYNISVLCYTFKVSNKFRVSLAMQASAKGIRLSLLLLVPFGSDPVGYGTYV